MRRLVSGMVVGLALVAAPLSAQDLLGRALDLEEQARWQDAAAAFGALLSREPVNAAALLGAERVYTRLGWRDSVAAAVARALAVDPAHVVARTIELRVARAAGGEALAAEALARWIAAAPRSEAPYQEWVRLLLAGRRGEEARQVVRVARERLGDPARLLPELALVEAAAGNWTRAAAEWRTAVLRQPGATGAAAFSLQTAPPPAREGVLRALTAQDSTGVARRLAGELLLAWNEPARAWATVRGALPPAPDERATALRTFADRARARGGADALRAAGEALDLLAASLAPPEAARLRVESARAFADAGDRVAARRVLRAMSEDPATPPDVAASAVATLVEVALGERDAAGAERLLDRQADRLPGREALRLAQLVARAWIAAGALDRAQEAIAADSSLAADEIRGWIALYRGDLRAARALLLGAGVRASDRGGAADRAGVVALLQAVGADSLRELGVALFLAARGDTLGASRVLVAVARGERVEGQAELLLWAARYAAAAGDSAGAEALWQDIAARHASSGAAPAALLAVARALAGRGEVGVARERLEELILRYPESALVPEARRELDRLRGGVPSS